MTDFDFSMDLTEVKMLLNEKIEYYKKNRAYYGGNTIPFDTRDYMALLVAIDVVNTEIEKRNCGADMRG